MIEFKIKEKRTFEKKIKIINTIKHVYFFILAFIAFFLIDSFPNYMHKTSERNSSQLSGNQFTSHRHSYKIQHFVYKY